MAAGLDYNDTFAPVPCIAVLRLFVAISTRHDWEMDWGDVDTAFLAACMDTLLYALVPNWFCADPKSAKPGHTVRQVLKSIPGIPQGPRLFNKLTHSVFTSLGMTQSKSEFCLYYDNLRKLYMVIWVDDIFIFYPTASMSHADTLWKGLQGHFQLADREPTTDILACVLKRDRASRVTTLSQEPAIRKLLDRLHLGDVNGKQTPMVANLKLSKKQCPSPEQAAVMVDEQREYRSTVASCIYTVGWTRPEASNAVNTLCRYMHNPGEAHITALKHLLRYLKATASKGLKYDFGPNSQASKTGIYGFFDASHADCVDTFRSTMGEVFFYYGCPIDWRCKLNTVITVSTNHSEYCASAKAARTAKWLEKIMLDINFEGDVKPIDLFSDSKGAIAMTYNPVNRAASKHIEVAHHYAREQQSAGTITISYVNTRDMVADIFTKPLGHADFKRHADKLVFDV